jgi:hypothetical protein
MGKTLMFMLGIIFLGCVLVIPSEIQAQFDGLPWDNGAETLTLWVVVPFLVALGWRFLSLRISVFSLCALLLLKVVLVVGSPASGWLIKMHPNLTQEQSAKIYPFQIVEGESWVRTYATLWNEEASGILKKPWTGKLNFPLDWALFKLGPCDMSTSSCFNELNPIVEIEGFLLLPENKKFAVIAKGVQEGTLTAGNESGDSFPLSPAKNLEEAVGEFYQLPTAGKWKISGKLTYQGADWSLIPVLIEADGKVTTNLGREVLWQSEQVDHIGFYKILSMIADGGIIIFLLVWLLWTIRLLIQKQILTPPLAVFSVLAVCMPFIMAPVFAKAFSIVGLVDYTTHSYIGISIVVAGIGFLIWTYWQKDCRNFQGDRIAPSVFLLFGPSLLCFFTNLWWFHIGKWYVWGAGNDWTSYQYFARKIVVDGEWLNAGEGVFVLQPLYRYFVGIYHLVFGQSAFVQHMADVWCVLGATIIVVAFAIKFRFPPILIFTVSIFYLAINFISSLRYIIGRGLVENHAMIFMMLAAWYLYSLRERGGYRIILATLFGVFGYWTRQDHLGAIAGLVFLALEPIEGPTGDWKEYWDRFKLQWKIFAWYWGGGILSVLLICFRHWWLKGVFYPTIKTHPNLDLATHSPFPGSLYLVITGKPWPSYPGMLGIILTIGVIVALLSLVRRPNALKNFPLGLSIIILGLLFPYAFLMTWAYPPRYSIHLFPLALLSIGFFLNYHLDRLKLPSKFNYQDK